MLSYFLNGSESRRFFNAVEKNDIDALKTILSDENVSLVTKQKYMNENLSNAIENNRIEVIKLFIQHNLNLNQAIYQQVFFPRNISPLKLAYEYKNAKIIAMFVEHNSTSYDMSELFNNYNLSLLRKVLTELKEPKPIVKIFLKKMGNLRFSDLKEITEIFIKHNYIQHIPIYMYIDDKFVNDHRYNHDNLANDLEDLVISCINEGADTASIDEFGRTALIKAVSLGKNLIINQLLQTSRTNINHRDNRGMTALMHSVNLSNRQNRIKSQYLLVNAGANLDLQNIEGNTALMLALKAKDITFAKKLIQSGANPHIRNIFGESALDLTQNNDILELIKAFGEIDIDLLYQEINRLILTDIQKASDSNTDSRVITQRYSEKVIANIQNEIKFLKLNLHNIKNIKKLASVIYEISGILVQSPFMNDINHKGKIEQFVIASSDVSSVIQKYEFEELKSSDEIPERKEILPLNPYEPGSTMLFISQPQLQESKNDTQPLSKPMKLQK